MSFWLLALIAAASSPPAPLRVDVYVPLCDSALIACGRGAAGDPHSLAGNLYWGAAYGVERFMSRAPGFKVIARKDKPRSDRPLLLREVRLSRAPGDEEREVEVRLLAYDGEAIDQALIDFLTAASGTSEADLVVWMGHDRLMDVAIPTLTPGDHPRPSIVLACSSRQFFEPVLQQLGSTPLAMTQSFMAPEAYLLEAATAALARRGMDKTALREALIDAYARYQKISRKAAATVFSRL